MLPVTHIRQAWTQDFNLFLNYTYIVRLLAVFAVPIHSVNEDGTYKEEEEDLYCDIFYHVNAVVCSLKSYFDHFGEPTCLQKHLS